MCSFKNFYVSLVCVCVLVYLYVGCTCLRFTDLARRILRTVSYLSMKSENLGKSPELEYVCEQVNTHTYTHSQHTHTRT